MKRLILFLVMTSLLVGIVSAAEDRTLYYGSFISVPGGAVAGNPFEAHFDFSYLNDFSNPTKSPLIIRLNFSSNDSEYPVWRNDFVVSGRVEKYALWGFVPVGKIYFECNNSEVQTIEHPLDAQTVYANNGTFYCYNSDGDLRLEEYDEIYLDIVSNYAIYPGEYNLTASMFYLTDERAPFVNITNKDIFDRYYREVDNVEIFADINDGSGIANKWGEAFLGYENWSVPFIEMSGDNYRFSRNTPIDIVEGNYPLYVFAEDEFGNSGNDSVILKIDRTTPEVVLVQPNESIYVDILPIEVSVSDEKAGLDFSSVEYRLREMNGSSICPEDGVGTWDCYDSGWLLLNYDVEKETFYEEVNTTEVGLNGEYWLEIRASDILGNMGILE